MPSKKTKCVLSLSVYRNLRKIQRADNMPCPLKRISPAKWWNPGGWLLASFTTYIRQYSRYVPSLRNAGMKSKVSFAEFFVPTTSPARNNPQISAKGFSSISEKTSDKPTNGEGNIHFANCAVASTNNAGRALTSDTKAKGIFTLWTSVRGTCRRNSQDRQENNRGNEVLAEKQIKPSPLPSIWLGQHAPTPLFEIIENKWLSQVTPQYS